MIHVFQVGGRSSDEMSVQVLGLPQAGVLELWFERTDLNGQQRFDSNFGQNYRFEVVPSATSSERPRDAGAIQVLSR